MLGHPCVACAMSRHDRCPGCTCSSAGHKLTAPTPAPPTRPAPGPGRGKDGLSAGQRRTARQKYDLERGVHPATRLALLTPAGDTEQCRNCVHLVALSNGNTSAWKCELHTLGLSHSAASDVRVSWPACIRYRPKDRG